MSFQTVINTNAEYNELSAMCEQKLKDLYLHMVLIGNIQKELKDISDKLLKKTIELGEELSTC